MADAILAGGDAAQIDEIYGRIYCITNAINGKQYVGQTVQKLSIRWASHKRQTGGCRALSNAIKKYGASNFAIEELAEAASQSELDELERHWISMLNTMWPNGYNLNSGGNGTGPLSPETKELARQAAKRRWQNEEYVKRHKEGVLRAMADPNIRAKIEAGIRSQAEKARRSEEVKRRWADPKLAAKMREDFLARIKTPEVNKKKSEANFKRYASHENRLAHSELMMRPEVRKRVAESNAKPEVKANRSAAAKLRWQKPGHREKVAASFAKTIAKKRGLTTDEDS